MNDILAPCKTAWQRKWLNLEVHHPEIQVLADNAEDYCRDFRKNNRERPLLVLAGDIGTAKSHVTQRVHDWVNALGLDAFAEGWGCQTPSSLYLPWPEVVSAFKNDHFGVLDDCKTTGLVILDDIGAEDDPWKNYMDQLGQILTYRESKRMFTLVTTNIEPEQWEAYFGKRIADRLCNSRIVDLFGVPSYRAR